MKETISKRLFLQSTACLTLGWRLRNKQVSAQSLPLAEKLRMENGQTVGERARSRFPGGILVEPGDTSAAVKMTSNLLQFGGPPSIFEGAFRVGEYVARADVLSRMEDSWHLSEVKSNTNINDQLINDVAYTLAVAGRSGLKVSKVFLLLISKDFRLGMTPQELFVQQDCTEEAFARVKLFDLYWDRVAESTASTTMPKPTLKPICKDCDLFTDCVGEGIDNPIFDLPNLSKKKVQQLEDAGVLAIEKIPPDFDLTDNQLRVRQAVLSGKTWVGPELKKQLDGIKFPAAYLDFESMTTGIPLYSNVAPYDQVPTQYSIHKCSSVGVVESHAEYIGDPRSDPRRPLTESLIADLAGAETIVTYSSFEKTRVSALAALFPDLAVALGDIARRLFDLNAVVRANFYHPSFHGRTSIKVTLPVLVPHMTYEGLRVNDGDSASAIFALMAMGKYTDTEIEQQKKDLLEYCEQDTLAMVLLHKSLFEALKSKVAGTSS